MPLPICPLDHSIEPPDCVIVQPTITAPAPPDFTQLLSSLDWSPIFTALLAVFAALAVVYVVSRGGSQVVNQIKPRHSTSKKYSKEEAEADPNSFHNWKKNRKFEGE